MQNTDIIIEKVKKEIGCVEPVKKDLPHKPVLLEEVLQYLDITPNKNYVDATINGGGHALRILKNAAPEGLVVGIDLEQRILENLKNRVPWYDRERLCLVCDNFSFLKRAVLSCGLDKVSGVLFDLGLSSWTLENSGRGFSFKKDEMLDMRFNQEIGGLTAMEIINDWSEDDLVEIFKLYGQERYAKIIAQNIVAKRNLGPIKTTSDLVELIYKSVPNEYRFGRIHPATRTFQALRICVNNELESLKQGLEQALEILLEGGRVVVISYHSLEDKIVKDFFRKKEAEGVLEIITKKPILPSRREVQKNARSRSAKMRVAQKL